MKVLDHRVICFPNTYTLISVARNV